MFYSNIFLTKLNYFNQIFEVNELIQEERWLSLTAILLAYGMSHITQTYLLSYRFKVSSSGFAKIVGWNIFTSIKDILFLKLKT